MTARSAAVVNSALWAAYGDALGWITELADAAKLHQRVGRERVDRLSDWHRHLPGQRPVRVHFPAGTYSDDTQLRLATGRAIRADGTFDVAAFAKVELPTWTNYALGGGVSTKEAAFSLAKASTQWYSNFFETKRARYLSAGGNGAAMRVQPHVWSAGAVRDPDRMLLDVIRNTICTHGHPRAIVGAALHALCLKYAIEARATPSMAHVKAIALSLEGCWDLIQSDRDLSLFWAGQWSDPSGPAEEAFRVVVYEVVSDLEALEQLEKAHRASSYKDVLRRLGLLEPKERGSGTKTAIAAAWLAFSFRDRGPQAAVVEAANELGSDTDTIATMVGALLGAASSEVPPQRLQDHDYLLSEANRLAAVASGDATTSFGYPDLRSYRPPRTAVDAVLRQDGGGYVVAGLGRAEPVSEFLTTNENNGDLRWLKLEFGQTILARVRPVPKEAGEVGRSLFEPTRVREAPQKHPLPQSGEHSRSRVGPNLEDMADEIARSGFAPQRLGEYVLRLCDDEREFAIERAVSLVAMVGSAYRRRGRGR
jgi:ADP-ribosylglycohydrolase